MAMVHEGAILGPLPQFRVSTVETDFKIFQPAWGLLKSCTSSGLDVPQPWDHEDHPSGYKYSRATLEKK